MTLARAGVLLTIVLAALFLPRPASAQVVVPPEREAFVVILDDATMEDLLAAPPLEGLASVGGAGLLSTRLPLRDATGFLIGDHAAGYSPVIPVVGLRYTDEGSVQAADGVASNGELLAVGDRLQANLRASNADDVLVIVASASPPQTSEAAGDLLSGVVVARGAPTLLTEAMGAADGLSELGSLTSDSTRRDGVVSSRDVPASVLEFLGATSTDGDPKGAAIRTIPGPPPLELHERYLAMRRMTVPIQTAAGLYVTSAGLFGVAVLASRRRAPRWLAKFAAGLALSVPPLAVALFAAGHLPTLSYATVVPFVVVVALLGTLAFVPLVRRDVLLPPAAMGAAVLAFFVVEAAVGWTAALTLFLAGSELDGGRFYGLPNEFIGLIAGCALYLVARMPAWTGFAVVVGAALFAGLPGIGANLGGALTLFAAAGLWVSQRRSGRIGWRGLALTSVVVAAGMAAVLAAHVFWTASPTHGTRFVQEQGRSLTGILDAYGDRLLVGWRLLERNPFALVPVVGLPAVLFVILRPPAPVRDAFERQPVWRDVVLVTVLSGIVAYLANDTGAAACGLAFALGLGGLMYVSLAVEAGKMERT